MSGGNESQLWDIQEIRKKAEDQGAERAGSHDGLDELNKELLGRGTSMDDRPAPPPQAPPPRPVGQTETAPAGRPPKSTAPASGGALASLRSKLLPRKRSKALDEAKKGTAESPPPPGLVPLRNAQAALVFMKPPASAIAACTRLVHSKLKAAGVEVVSEGKLQGGAIAARGLIDAHYGAVANRAVRWQPHELTVPASGQAAFLHKFGLPWAAAVEEGRVLNAADAAARFGLDTAALEVAWGTIPDRDLLKIAEGFYCGRMEGKEAQQAAPTTASSLDTKSVSDSNTVGASSAASQIDSDDSNTVEVQRAAVAWGTIPDRDLLKIAEGFYCGRMEGKEAQQAAPTTTHTASSLDTKSVSDSNTVGASSAASQIDSDDSNTVEVQRAAAGEAAGLKTKTANDGNDEHDDDDGGGGGSGYFVVNGFYLGMREKFVAPSSVVHWFSVRFPLTLAFTDFREKVIGATNPSKAAEGSIRRALFEQWKELGLAAEPNTSSNGVHASASPLEGLFERMNWLGLSPSEDPYGRELMRDAGVPQHALEAWAEDATVSFKGSPHSVFELHRGLDSPQCTKQAALVYASDRKVKEALAKARAEGNRAVFGDAATSY
eukprot:CAMPEP_0171984986 /NCGR_PEP_ID=MMETSP0993-20121228/274110_1 /TAXON_ID=483369 /ORGANISM="non described non described, Strain CCMP2098" /LENGTH=604 /DNA_ID=CAMNT_0012637827 /DNA_START=75 /DNA_END=1889 /DNA_ORIENTATION=+